MSEARWTASRNVTGYSDMRTVSKAERTVIQNALYAYLGTLPPSHQEVDTVTSLILSLKENS
jgi:hypothetical protein